MPSPSLLIARHDTGDEPVLTLQGDLDEETGREVLSVADDLVAAGARRVTVDLRGLVFLDSGGLHALATLDDALRRSGGRATFVAPPPALHRLFAAVGLHDLAFVDPA